MVKKENDAVVKVAGRQTLDLGSYRQAVEVRLDGFKDADIGGRLWRKDASLWSGNAKEHSQVGDSLGWLDAAATMAANQDLLLKLRQEVLAAGFRRVVHMGMGGSSLAPLVMAKILPGKNQGLPLTVLDTTDSATILKIEKEAPLTETIFIVASKSGTTAEPRAFAEYFFRRVSEAKGGRAGENFIAITDPGSPLAQSAAGRDFRHVFLNFPDIGGRYSALSFFGLVPAALAGADTEALLKQALGMQRACAAEVPVQANPGLVLGAALGELALQGRDKVTFLSAESIAPLGMWLEQLLAESTGKKGRGLLPVAGEAVGSPGVYGTDRLFVYLWAGGDPALEAAVDKLKAAGQPVVTIRIDEPYQLGQEFFRWEAATAVAGIVLGVNPFDQPNVQESKDNTNRLLDQVAKTGELPPETPLLVEAPLGVYYESFKPPVVTVAEAIGSFLSEGRPGGYLALMAYLAEDKATAHVLARLQAALRDRLHLAVTVGFGPRFLHSTGQFHKGGPAGGLFLQLTCDDAEDALIPGAAYGFSVFKQAQALGDFMALRRHGRKVMRVHLGGDPKEGLARVEEIVRNVKLDF